MPILDSKTGQVRQSYNLRQLKEAANYMRGLDLVALNCAGSGHSGGTLSIMDITAALYLKIARHDPKNPDWDKRDRIIWSAGHKAPALYLGLGMAGYFPVEQVMTLRKFSSPFQGHPHWLKLKGVEVSTGSLGQGFGIGVGMALRAKLDKKKFRLYVITGDGEWDEGSMWESAMEAANYNLDNLVVIVDRNRLQIDGETKKVMKLIPLEKKIASFGFKVIKIDGHKMESILTAFQQAQKIKGQPTAIIAETIKGKGVSFMENVAGWHGKTPNDEELEKGLKELGLWRKIDLKKLKEIANKYQQQATKKINRSMPKFSRDYFWNQQPRMKVEMVPTRNGFGDALDKYGNDKKVVCLGLDISGSVRINKFYQNHPERKKRFLSMGIQEASGTCVAAGLAREGKLPVISTYGVFCSQRNADQMRTTVCYGNLNVLFGGAHGGISVGPDGATHQALEEFSVVGILPNMKLVVPADALETERATKYCLFRIKGPKYLRFAREATPVITDRKTPFVFGKANVIRFRGEKENFKDAFMTVLASKYKNEGEPIALISCGPETAEAMRAAWILKQEYHLESRVLNIHTLKPLDKEAIVKTAREVQVIVTAEEHQKGGFGDLVSAAILEAGLKKTPKFGMIGVNDRFGDSGQPWELMKAFGLTAEYIVQKVINLRRKK